MLSEVVVVCNHSENKWVKGSLYMVCENGCCFLTVEEYNAGLR